jgi:hypothetical protein
MRGRAGILWRCCKDPGITCQFRGFDPNPRVAMGAFVEVEKGVVFFGRQGIERRCATS